MTWLADVRGGGAALKFDGWRERREREVKSMIETKKEQNGAKVTNQAVCFL